MKIPRDNLIKCQHLSLAESCGDGFTHCILTEPDKSSIPRKVLMRSVVKTRRRDIGLSTEHVNEDPDMESFTLSLAESQSVNSQHQKFTDVPLLVAGDRVSLRGNDQDQDQQAASQKDADMDTSNNGQDT